MKHPFVLIALLLVQSAVCPAQTPEKTKHNALLAELGKPGLVFNLAFDHRFSGSHFGLRLTAGSNFVKYLNAVTAGGGGYYLFGKANHHLELGLDIAYLNVDELSDDQRGLAFIYPDYSIKTAYASMNIGYRRYGDKTLFRIGVSPGVINSQFLRGAYIGLGLLF